MIGLRLAAIVFLLPVAGLFAQEKQSGAMVYAAPFAELAWPWGDAGNEEKMPARISALAQAGFGGVLFAVQRPAATNGVFAAEGLATFDWPAFRRTLARVEARGMRAGLIVPLPELAPGAFDATNGCWRLARPGSLEGGVNDALRVMQREIDTFYGCTLVYVSPRFGAPAGRVDLQVADDVPQLLGLLNELFYEAGLRVMLDVADAPGSPADWARCSRFLLLEQPVREPALLDRNLKLAREAELAGHMRVFGRLAGAEQEVDSEVRVAAALAAYRSGVDQLVLPVEFGDEALPLPSREQVDRLRRIDAVPSLPSAAVGATNMVGTGLAL